MGWRQTLALVSNFEDSFTRLSNRVETANNRGEKLGWANYRIWYQRLVQQTKRHLRSLKRELSDDIELGPILTGFETSLKNVFDIDSDSQVKWADLRSSKPTWQLFKAELDRKLKQEYDLFPKRKFDVDEKLCFVLMPFKKPFNIVYSGAIRPAVKNAKLRPKRADEIFTPTPIVKDIWEYINKATLIIADATERNANVFYEIGLAHALPKRLIILTQKKEDVPFDLQYIRWIPYANTVRGRQKLLKELKKSIKAVLA